MWTIAIIKNKIWRIIGRNLESPDKFLSKLELTLAPKSPNPNSGMTEYAMKATIIADHPAFSPFPVVLCFNDAKDVNKDGWKEYEEVIVGMLAKNSMLIWVSMRSSVG